jgi:flagellar biogenesis protein FliO
LPSYSGYLVETLVTLVAVCALAVVVLWAARRVGLGRPTGPLELRGHLSLDARRAIYLVEVADRVFVLGASEAGITKLGEVGASELAAVPPEPIRSFAAILSRTFAREHRAASAPEVHPDGLPEKTKEP